MAETEIVLYGIEDIEDALRELGSSSFQNRLISPGLAKVATVIRRQAATRNFGFTDRNAPRRESAQYRSLRRSIRRLPVPGYYGGRRYKRGRSGVFAGGPGARQAHLVEEGHGGPRPARPHSFLRKALLKTVAEQGSVFVNDMRSRFPSLAARYAKRSTGRSRRLSSVHSRTVSRRARSRIR